MKFDWIAGFFLVVSALFLFSFNFDSLWAETEKNIVPVKAELQKQNRIIVYYFYGKPRCISCKKIEAYTQEAVNGNFSEELKNNSLELKMVDLDKAENKHFYKDYKLYTKAVVLSKIKEGKEIKSKNLDKIWTKLKNKEKFKQYIIEEINKFMEK